MRRPPALQGPQPCLGNCPIMVSVEVDSLRSGMATAAGPKAKGADLFTQGMVWPTEPSGVSRTPGRHPGLSLCSQWGSLRLGPAEARPGWGLAHVLRVSGGSVERSLFLCLLSVPPPIPSQPQALSLQPHPCLPPFLLCEPLILTSLAFCFPSVTS